MSLQYYLEKLDYSNIPGFLVKYLDSPSLLRLKKVGYFCGMDFASKDIYNFSEYISRFDHSLSVALLTYKLTQDKLATLAGLIHDIATPCFSHVIDYMNGDFEKQESTEQYTEKILRNDIYLINCLTEDNINIDDIINFKNYSVVDIDRPKLCADRLDGVILPGLAWTKNIDKQDIDNIINDITVIKNEYNENEISFKSLDVATKVLQVSESIDACCHSKEDNYMMQLLANITKLAIEENYITYDDLYEYNEEELLKLFRQKNNDKLNELLYKFEHITQKEISYTKLDNVKIKALNPIVNGKRLNS